MKKCLIIINKAAGNSKKMSTNKVICRLGDEFEYTTIYTPENDTADLTIYDSIAVCGGDGTLSNVLSKVHNLNITVYYFPCGTLNDKAKGKRISDIYTNNAQPMVVGKLDDTVFTYVLAAGAFTPIGYRASVINKKRLGVFAYMLKILSSYKIWRIKAEIDLEGEDFNTEHFEGEFNLIMFIKSPRCFGFRFNRDYDEDRSDGHAILIHSPKHNGLLGYIEMFFPFFRVFFMGFKKPYRSKNVIYTRVKKAQLQFEMPTTFDKDGEFFELPNDSNLLFDKTDCLFQIIDK